MAAAAPLPPSPDLIRPTYFIFPDASLHLSFPFLSPPSPFCLGSGPAHRALPLQVRPPGGRADEGGLHGQPGRPAHHVSYMTENDALVGVAVFAVC